jgi:protein ImuA
MGSAEPYGLARGGVYEAVPAAYLDGPAAAGLVLGFAAMAMAQAPGGALCLVGPGAEEFGAPYAPGLQRLGMDPSRLLFARARTSAEAMAALEEAARTPGLSAVFGLAPARVEEAAGRRLQRAAEAVGAFVALWRPFGAPVLSGARGRWLAAAAPSVRPAFAEEAGLRGRAAPPGPFRAKVQAQKGRSLEEDQIWEWRDAAHGFYRIAVVDRAAARDHEDGRRRSWRDQEWWGAEAGCG